MKNTISVKIFIRDDNIIIEKEIGKIIILSQVYINKSYNMYTKKINILKSTPSKILPHKFKAGL